MTSPNSGNLDDKIIRADGRGRLLVRAQQRAAILKAFDETSMSAMTCARALIVSMPWLPGSLAKIAVAARSSCSPTGPATRTRNRIKLLHWDGTGLWVQAKRLEKGTFSWPKPSDGSSGKLKLAPEALAMLTDGIDLKGAKMRPWYERDCSVLPSATPFVVACPRPMTPEREQQLVDEVAYWKREHELLRQKLDLMLRKLFGKSSESLDPPQLELLLGTPVSCC